MYKCWAGRIGHEAGSWLQLLPPHAGALQHRNKHFSVALSCLCLINLPACLLSLWMKGRERRRRRHELSHLSPRHTMQLKVNGHQQKQEKKYTFTLSSPLFSPEGLFTEAFEVPPPLFSSPLLSSSPLCLALSISWQCDTGRQYWRWEVAVPQRRLPRRWSQKIFISNWIFPSVRYLLNCINTRGWKQRVFREGPPAARRKNYWER